MGAGFSLEPHLFLHKGAGFMMVLRKRVFKVGKALYMPILAISAPLVQYPLCISVVV